MTVSADGHRADGFWAFYRGEYAKEHQQPVSVALHVLGTLAGVALLVAGFTIWPLWSVLLFPLVHVVPGLIGHRLFERNQVVGNVRVLRKDYPVHWFMIANHLLTLELPLKLIGYRR